MLVTRSAPSDGVSAAEPVYLDFASGAAPWHPLRWKLCATVGTALLVAAVTVAWTAHRADPSAPHGNPDPGGTRVAYLQRVGHAAVPSGGSILSITVHKYSWD